VSGNSDYLDLMSIQPGARVRLSDGSIVVVVDNPRDGAWLMCRPVDGTDEDKEAVFVSDIEGEEEMR
jgi:hypothetical protein